MTDNPTETAAADFAAWLSGQLTPQPAQPSTEPAAPSGPRPDPSQGGSDETVPLDGAIAFASLLNQL